MKQGWKKIITLALALALVLSVMPSVLTHSTRAQAEGAVVTANGAYGYVTADEVKVRRQPSTSSVYWFKVNVGFVAEILGVEQEGGVTWYKVNSPHPNNNGRTYIGYIHGDFFKPMTAEEVEQWQQGTGSGSGSSSGATGGTTGGTSSDSGVNYVPSVTGYVQLILSSANLRNGPGGSVVTRWENKGEIIPYYGAPVAKGNYQWYNVVYYGVSYYVRNDCVQTVTAEGMPVTPAPAATPAPGTVTGYVITTKGGVNLRLKPAGETVTQVAKNVVVPCVGNTVSSGGYNWFYVEYNGMRGYLRSDCVAVCNADGSTSGVTQAPSVDNGTTSAPAVYGYVRMTATGVNLRVIPAGSSQEQLSLGLVVPVTGPTVTSGKYTWYPVKAPSGRTGYVRGDCVVVCNADGTTDGAALAPGAGGSTGSTSTSSYGYIQLTKGGVNLRDSVGGKTLTQLAKGTVWPMTGSMQTVNNVIWYPINADGRLGFIRGDCAFKLSPTQEQSYLAGTGVPSEPVTPVAPASTYLRTTVAAVNLRASASKDSKAEFNVELGTVMAYNSTTTSGGETWYRVVYGNKEVWVLGSCVAIMTAEEYQAYIAANPNNTPQPEVAVGYVKTTLSSVNIRSTAGGSTVLTRVDKDIIMPYLAAPVSARNYMWYLVKTPDGTRGYIRHDCIMVCNSDGSPAPTPAPGGSSGSTGQEATYETLRLGSTGEAVEKLVTELRNQGYYTGEITSTYTTAVRDAVTAYQKDKGLSADGIAGPVTQHSLFGTVPAGSGTGDLTITLYPAEKIDWFTGGIQQLWPKGANFKVYDVQTGIVWWAHRWSGFNHADVEPLTAADTARLCKIYGVSSADQITDKAGHWRRRPCLVTIGTRTFACSLYGVPHNAAGDTIADNNLTGQICIHFTNSRTSDTDLLDADHQEAIDYAWKNAPNGHI